MAVKKRSGAFYVYFRPFKKEQIGIKLDVARKTEAKQVEAMLTRACRTGDYGILDAQSRNVCITMFRRQGWELPETLVSDHKPEGNGQLTLFKSCEIFLKSPEIRDAPSRGRYEICIVHLFEKFGMNFPVKDLWTPELKRYQVERLNDGAAPDTINWETSTLSRIFGILIDHRLVQSNPARLIKRLSNKSGQRQAYLSMDDVLNIADTVPNWARAIILTAYHTGMRRGGELLGLTRKQVGLSRRMITLSPDDTKEGHWKRVPIHHALAPILRESLKVTCFGSEKVFHLIDNKGIRPLDVETFKNVWPRAMATLKFKAPLPRFHDLRHTWKTNARRSRMDSEIRESILGHGERGLSVRERYGRIDDGELLNAIDHMTFDHGETEIFVARKSGATTTPEKCKQIVNKPLRTKKKSGSG